MRAAILLRAANRLLGFAKMVIARRQFKKSKEAAIVLQRCMCSRGTQRAACAQTFNARHFPGGGCGGVQGPARAWSGNGTARSAELRSSSRNVCATRSSCARPHGAVAPYPPLMLTTPFTTALFPYEPLVYRGHRARKAYLALRSAAPFIAGRMCELSHVCRLHDGGRGGSLLGNAAWLALIACQQSSWPCKRASSSPSSSSSATSCGSVRGAARASLCMHTRPHTVAHK